jgi:hypothetical protein
VKCLLKWEYPGLGRAGAARAPSASAGSVWWFVLAVFETRERPRRRRARAARAARAAVCALGSGARVCRLSGVWRLPSRGAARAALSGLRRADPARLHIFTTSPRLALQMYECEPAYEEDTCSHVGALQMGGEASGRGRSRSCFLGARAFSRRALLAPWRASCTKPSRLRAVQHRAARTLVAVPLCSLPTYNMRTCDPRHGRRGG